MPQPDPRPPTTSTGGRIAFWVALVMTAVLVLIILRTCHHDTGPTPGTAAASLSAGRPVAVAPPSGRGAVLAAQFDRQIDTSLEPGALVFKALKLQFPQDYAEYLRLFADRSGSGEPVEKFKAETQAWLASFMARHRADLTRASDVMLLASVNAQMGAAIVLKASSPTLCAHYATSGFQPGDTPPSQQALAALDEANAIKINAMGEGRKRPARPEPTTMAQADATAFAAGIQRLGGSADDLQKVASPATAATVPVERQCDISIKMLQAIVAMPKDQAGRVASVVFQDPAKIS